MREIARVAQGYFPTQDRIVAALSRLIAPHPQATTVVDAGCGCGKAIADLRQHWIARATATPTIKLYGIESDRDRHRQASELLSGGPGGGEALWSAIEDASPDGGASLLFFNPPYDRIRGAGRMELNLFNHVKHWCRRDGVLVLIVPDYILSDAQTGLAAAVERDYRVLVVYRYPEPEYQSFKQCVLIAQRRERALNKERIGFPAWAEDAASWRILPDRAQPLVTLPAGDALRLRRVTLSQELLLEVLSRSPLRNSLLREALAPAPAIERPLLPLKAGHLALALAGGLCDGVVDHEGVRFLVKGTLERKTCHTKSTARFDADGNKTADVDVFRTVYAMKVRCLRENGTLENYTSSDGEDVGTDSTEEEVTA